VSRFYVLLSFFNGLPPNNTTDRTKEWSREDDVEESPTNAFGHINFENVDNSTLESAKVCY